MNDTRNRNPLESEREAYVTPEGDVVIEGEEETAPPATETPAVPPTRAPARVVKLKKERFGA